MRALYQVKNKCGNTAGFILENNEYINYYGAVKNVDYIDNLTMADDKRIVATEDKTLEEVSLSSVNNERYNKLCRDYFIRRDVQDKFEEWKAHWSKKALYLSGARQTGKTTELLKFAYKNYEQIIYVNLADKKELSNFEEYVLGNMNASFGLAAYCEKCTGDIFENSKDTILIMDEIQESSVIYNSIRRLLSELKCHIVITGSYLGRVLNSEFFKPAGNTYDIEMLPVSFAEFCRIFDKEELLNNIDISGKSESEDYVTLTDLYKVYRDIGGYPEVVAEYMRTKDIGMCMKVIADLVNRFTDESACYFHDDKSRNVFNSVYKAAAIMQAREKKGTDSKLVEIATNFVKDDIKSVVGRSEVNKAISWLIYNGILGTCDLYNQGNVLDLLQDRRIYFRDCGLFNYIARQAALDNDTINGLLTETFAYNELYRVYTRPPQIVKGDKPCCSVYDKYELDFMVVRADDVKYGIEIKRSKSNNPQSLGVYLERNLVDKGFIAEITKGGMGERWRTIPVYTIGVRFPYE